jgi:hypothetical protein
MSKKHVAAHFDAFIGEILRRIPEADRKTFRVVVEDSYETGGQNWTDDMIGYFKTAYGYDPVPYLPVLKGTVVGNPDLSDRFLWDLRRLVADKVAYDYVAGLKEVSNKNGAFRANFFNTADNPTKLPVSSGAKVRWAILRIVQLRRAHIFTANAKCGPSRVQPAAKLFNAIHTS